MLAKLSFNKEKSVEKKKNKSKKEYIGKKNKRVKNIPRKYIHTKEKKKG
jgi:hypothetical protein